MTLSDLLEALGEEIQDAEEGNLEQSPANRVN